jgi:hypothetical protein
VRPVMAVLRRLGLLHEHQESAAECTTFQTGMATGCMEQQLASFWELQAALAPVAVAGSTTPCCGTLYSFARDLYQPHEDLRLKTLCIPGYVWRSAQRFCTGTHDLAGGRLARRVLGRGDTGLQCRMCQTGEVEDEHHFFCQCPAYAHIRSQFPALFPALCPPSECLRAAFTYALLPRTGFFLLRAFAHRKAVLSETATQQ